MKKITSDTRLIISFAISLFLILVAVLLQYRSLNDYQDTSELARHTSTVIATIDQTTSSLYQAEANLRGYFLTKKDRSLIGYREAALNASTLAKSLVTLVADSNQQLVHTHEYLQLVENRIDSMESSLAKYRKIGISIADDDTLVDKVARDRAKIADTARSIKAEEERVLYERSRTVQKSVRFAQTSGLAIALLVVLGLALIVFNYVRDERARKKRDAEIRDSEALLQQILENMPIGVALCDENGNPLKINQAAKDIWGEARYVDVDHFNEYRGWFADTGKALDSGDWAMARTLRTGETIRNEVIDIQAFDGRRKTIMVSTMPIIDSTDQMKGVIATNLDITDQRRTQSDLEHAMRLNETKRLALSLFTAGFDRRDILDRFLALLAIRHPFLVSALYVFDEWTGTYRIESKHGVEDDALQEFRPGEGLLGEAAQQGILISVPTRQLRLRTGIADYEPAEVLVLPLTYQGKCSAVLVVGSSEPLSSGYRPFLESLGEQTGIALHNLKQFDDLKILSEQLRTSGEEIQEKNRQLEEASRMKTEFLANMSHEFRTPLNAIIGFSEVLKDGIVGKISDKQREYANDIFESGQHLLSLINDILDLSKIEGGMMLLNLDRVNIKSLAAASLQIVRERAQSHRITLEENVQDGVGDVYADERKVKQILFNLLSNAVKFTPDGGIVALTARKVSNDASQEGKPTAFLELSIRDTGIGISREDQEKLFRPFVQIDGALSRKFEGTGLGLAMVRRLAELHGGSVRLESEPGKGSCFTVLLPWREDGITQTSAPAAIEEKKSAGEIPAIEKSSSNLALIVEDDNSSADLFQIHLNQLGFRTARVRNAERAIESFAEEIPGLIILDILLPEMDGWKLLEKIKSKPETSSVPVVIASIVADRHKGLALGAAHVLQKPVSRDDLSDALKAIGLPTQGMLDEKVLIIDDDPKSVRLFSTYFEKAGYQVYSAFGGKEGIASAQKKKPDAIVLDLMMPDINGFDVAEALSRDKRTTDIPIIVVTAKQITEDDRNRLNGEVVRIIEKTDFNPEIFLNEVRRAVNERGQKNAKNTRNRG